jgi:hypothetical protein
VAFKRPNPQISGHSLTADRLDGPPERADDIA